MLAPVSSTHFSYPIKLCTSIIVNVLDALDEIV